MGLNLARMVPLAWLHGLSGAQGWREGPARLRCYGAHPGFAHLFYWSKGQGEEEGSRAGRSLPPSSLDRCGAGWGAVPGLRGDWAARGEAGPLYLQPEAGG